MRGRIVTGSRDLGELAVLAALLLFVAGLALQPITESDLFFRLKVGQEIWARRGLLDRNLFSFTAPDHPDLDLAWLFEIGVAGLYRLGGFSALVAAKAIALAATFTGAFAVCRRWGSDVLVTALVLAGAAWVMRERFVERPHVVSFAGEVGVLAALGRLDSRWPARARATFAAAMVLWANTHAGWFAAPFMLLAAAAAEARRDRAAARRALGLAAIAVAAGCLTPVGPFGIMRYLAMHVTLPRLHSIDEFRAATWRSDAPLLFTLMAAAALAIVAAFVDRSPRHAGGEDALPATAPPRPLARLGLPALGMAGLGLLSVRFAADAVLVAAPLAATSLSRLLDIRRRRRAAPQEPGAAAPPDASNRIAVTLVLLALLAATAAPRLAAARAGRPAFDAGVDWSEVPLDANRFVEAHGLRDRMYNDFELGSYLLFEGYPRYRVFVDPRLPAYPEEMHRLLGDFDLDRASWNAAMAKYGVTSALLAYAGLNRRVAWWDPELWALVYRAHDARVLVRRSDHRRTFIAAHEIPATFDFSVERGAFTLPIDRQPASSPVPACEWQQRLGDLVFDLDGGRTSRARAYYERALERPACLPAADEARLAAWMGALDLAAAGWPAALARFDRALGLAPGDVATRANRATVLERLGRRGDAAADWARVAAEAKNTSLRELATSRVHILAAP